MRTSIFNTNTSSFMLIYFQHGNGIVYIHQPFLRPVLLFEAKPIVCCLVETVGAVQALAMLCYAHSFNLKPSISFHHSQFYRNKINPPRLNTKLRPITTKSPLYIFNDNGFKLICLASRRKPTTSKAAVSSGKGNNGGVNSDAVRKLLQAILWVSEGVYILWLFLLPYAPGDPVWAISKDTINSLIGLSLNFFFILPLINSVGIHLIDAPVLHPVSEGLFNFVIGWTFMFAPLLFTDCKRDGYKGSLDVLWGLQMFLTNAFLIPYMAIRLNEANSAESVPRERSQLGMVMTRGARIVGLIGGVACLISISWALYGRMDGNFGSIADRWEFLISYLGSERLAYAFICDICFYIVFQPWLIGDNMQNVQKSKIDVVNYLRFVPVVGLVAYLLCLNLDEVQ